MILCLIIIGIILSLYGVFKLVKRFLKRQTAWQIEESYDCMLIAQDNFEQKFEGYIWDFSQYEDKGIIGMQLYSCMKRPRELETNFTEPIIIKDALVHKLKNGCFIWDYDHSFKTRGGFI